jgi:hypothetical protein
MFLLLSIEYDFAGLFSAMRDGEAEERENADEDDCLIEALHHPLAFSLMLGIDGCYTGYGV